jgi:hypothetical protein
MVGDSRLVRFRCPGLGSCGALVSAVVVLETACFAEQPFAVIIVGAERLAQAGQTQQADCVNWRRLLAGRVACA